MTGRGFPGSNDQLLEKLETGGDPDGLGYISPRFMSRNNYFRRTSAPERTRPVSRNSEYLRPSYIMLRLFSEFKCPPPSVLLPLALPLLFPHGTLLLAKPRTEEREGGTDQTLVGGPRNHHSHPMVSLFLWVSRRRHLYLYQTHFFF